MGTTKRGGNTGGNGHQGVVRKPGTHSLFLPSILGRYFCLLHRVQLKTRDGGVVDDNQWKGRAWREVNRWRRENAGGNVDM